MGHFYFYDNFGNCPYDLCNIHRHCLIIKIPVVDKTVVQQLSMASTYHSTFMIALATRMGEDVHTELN